MRWFAFPFTAIFLALFVVGCADRILSKDVTFDDPGLQQCYEDALRGPSGKPYADEIQVLHCFEYGIVDLAGIEVLSGLKELTLRGNVGITNIEPVLSLRSLVWLDLPDCALQPDSTAILSRLRTPVRLNVSGNNLGDISAYSQTTSLTALIVDESNITNGVADLVTLTNATALSFALNPRSPCSDLEILRMSMAESTIVLPIPAELEPGVDCAQ
ncbi:MAG: hypothetical protein MJE77_17960 [Proteobacteria bacterium]|nr:hypothetical protein [Pseudomonadota bacterium]